MHWTPGRMDLLQVCSEALGWCPTTWMTCEVFEKVPYKIVRCFIAARSQWSRLELSLHVWKHNWETTRGAPSTAGARLYRCRQRIRG